MTTTVTDSPVIDPITLAIKANRLDSITREMTNTMIRTARSTTMAARDFSCSITSADHQLLSAPGGIPVHVYGSSLVAEAMVNMHPDFTEGDCFLHNDPYMGNTHAADHTFLVPVFHRGRHVFTAIAKAHQVDCGDSEPTTYMPAARDVYHEGALIFPAVRIQRDYEDVKDVVRMCEKRIRAFDTWYGDYLASLGAVRLAEKRLHEFCESFDNDDELDAFVEAWLDYGERMAAASIAKLPAGTHKVQTQMDAFPGLPDGLPLQADIEVLPDEGRVIVDLRDNPDCTPTGLNLTEASSMNAAVTAVLMVLNTDAESTTLHVPNNSGSHRRIEVLVRENCVVGIPRHPASCSVATRTVTDRVAGMILAGFAEMTADGIAAAEPPLGCPPHEGVIAGVDPRRDEDFIFQVFSGSSGGPATADADGWLSFATIMGGGLPLIDSSEIVEQRYPLIVWQRATVWPDSEGAGHNRGATGTSSAYGPRYAVATSSYYMDGVDNRPKGVRGGQEASGPEAWRIGPGGRSEQIHDNVASVDLQRFDAIVSHGSGAGGYGDPLLREPERVLEDVIDEYISVGRAREAYGVVLAGDPTRWETLSVDIDATAALRTSLRAGTVSADAGRHPEVLTAWWPEAS
ncbi:hydantoinase B/oxoprolinase family protein [Demequina salsinemoris]|uniref:hydantoinase B/oxoprolinase family protein n=1 Tax=Demequina salsinemoris TaxID=577470 RepID=UPI0007846437|nr:hydantoinase B/oxoprolinase family protein [Demequina salsinemoris]